MKSPDRFGAAASQYVTFRPHYPEALFDRVASLPARRGIALDCGTGSGQAAGGLVRRFDRVVAMDASEPQLSAGLRHVRVLRVRGASERIPLATGVVDLVTVAQALHWFDVPTFFEEASRVLADGGAVAVWTYDQPAVNGDIDAVLEHFYRNVVGAWWAPQRRIVEERYRTIPFPFDEVEIEPMEISAELTLDQLVGYAGTWSATLARTAAESDPIPALRADLTHHWPDPAERRLVRWPLTVRAGRVARHSV